MLSRHENETKEQQLVRLVVAKYNGELEATWKEIAEAVDLGFQEDHVRKMSYGIKLAHDVYSTVGVSGKATRRILSISDLHVPFQLDYHLLERYRGVDILQINGDVCDCQALSKFPKIYRKSPMEEIIESRQYLLDLIRYIKPKQVIITYGNHDLRFGNYFAKKLEDELVELMPSTSLDLIINTGFWHYDKMTGEKSWFTGLKPMLALEGIEVSFDDNWFVQIGDAIFCHPKGFKSGMMKTAEQAMQFFRNEDMQFHTLVMAHTHRLGQYRVGKTTLFEQGCFCDVAKNNYTDGLMQNSQREGYLYLEQDCDGNTVNYKLEELN